MTSYQITKRSYGLWTAVQPSTDNETSFTFQTRWAEAKDPNELQNKFQMILSENEIRRLIEVLTLQLK